VSKKPKTTSTFGSFLSRQCESNKRRNEIQSMQRDPEYSFSPHLGAVGAKVAQVPPIFSHERAAMMSSAAERARSKIASEVMEANTFRFVRPESSQKAIAESAREMELFDLRKVAFCEHASIVSQWAINRYHLGPQAILKLFQCIYL
jgi:hypothetical protein